MKILEHLVKPFLAVSECSKGSHVPHDVDAWNQPLREIFPFPSECRILDNSEPAMESSKVIGFAGGHERHCLIRYLRA